jgi:hypothetical protein
MFFVSSVEWFCLFPICIWVGSLSISFDRCHFYLFFIAVNQCLCFVFVGWVFYDSFYIMLCSVFFSFSFSSLDNGYVFNLFIRYFILNILCSCGRQESLSIITSVSVGFLYIANSSLFLLCIKRLIKLMELCDSFSIANFIAGCCEINSVKESCMFFFGYRLKACHQHI